MTDNIKTDFYFLSPVETVEVTSKNLEEVAKWCDGRVAKTDEPVKGRSGPYVWVPTPKSSGISWAFPGMFVTKRLAVSERGDFKATYAVFTRNYFKKNYFDSPSKAVEQTWEQAAKNARMNERVKTAIANGKIVVNITGDVENVENVIEEIQGNLDKMAQENDIDLTTPVEEGA